MLEFNGLPGRPMNPGESHATYIGSRSDLRGKTALLHSSEQPGQVLVQFDALDIPEAFGWHPFQIVGFE